MGKSKLLIIGSGEHTRIAIDLIEDQGVYDIFGLVTNNRKECGNLVFGHRVVCTDDDLEQVCRENKDIRNYFLGIGISSGSMKARLSAYRRIGRLLEPVNVISPDSVISKYAKLGTGVMIEPYVRIANGVTMGEHCIVQSFTSINHDQIVGDNVLIGCNVAMAGRRIGPHSTIADGSTIGFKKQVGLNCLITDGTVVTKDVPDNVIAFGNPARTLPRDPIL